MTGFLKKCDNVIESPFISSVTMRRSVVQGIVSPLVRLREEYRDRSGAGQEEPTW